MTIFIKLSLLKSNGKSLTLVECRNFISRILIYKSKQYVLKFVAKLRKYKILFKDTLLVLDL